jgi:hypothetical protein
MTTTTIMRRYEEKLHAQKKAAEKVLAVVEVEIAYLDTYSARRKRRAKRLKKNK